MGAIDVPRVAAQCVVVAYVLVATDAQQLWGGTLRSCDQQVESCDLKMESYDI